jgi:hypothetical protein
MKTLQPEIILHAKNTATFLDKLTSQPDFKNGVSPAIVESMLGEVMDSMIFYGQLTKEQVIDLPKSGVVISELVDLISAHLNIRILS